MKEKEMKNFYQKEHEIPELVEDKLQEAYREIRENEDKGRKVILFPERNRWKVAMVACLCLVLSATAGAAIRHFDGLRQFFGSIEPIKESVKEVEEDKISNTFPNLTVNVEEMAGTDREVYMIVNVKRTDGKLFEKGFDYRFENIQMIAEGESDGYSPDFISAQMGAWQQTLKNEGTDEITMVLVYNYERKEYDDSDGSYKPKSFYHRGETCTLSVKDLICEQNGLGAEMSGEIKTKIKLDYGEASVKECQPDVKIRLPRMDDSDKYVAATVKSIRINPYYMEYTYKFDKLWEEHKSPTDGVREEIYLEMEDGTKYGPKTPQEFYDYFDNSRDEEDRLAYSMTSTLWFKQVLDVNKIQAVWFGNKRIPLEK